MITQFRNTEECTILEIEYDSTSNLFKQNDGLYSIFDKKNPKYNETGAYRYSSVYDYLKNSRKGKGILAISVYENILKIGSTIYSKTFNEHIVVESISLIHEAIFINDKIRVSEISFETEEERKERLADQQLEEQQVCLQIAPYMISEDNYNLQPDSPCFSVTADFEILTHKSAVVAKGLVFAEKENAQNYVLYNKPCFTLQEMLNLHSTSKHDKYINLAKTKMEWMLKN